MRISTETLDLIEDVIPDIGEALADEILDAIQTSKNEKLNNVQKLVETIKNIEDTKNVENKKKDSKEKNSILSILDEIEQKTIERYKELDNKTTNQYFYSEDNEKNHGIISNADKIILAFTVKDIIFKLLKEYEKENDISLSELSEDEITLMIQESKEQIMTDVLNYEKDKREERKENINEDIIKW